MKNFTKHIATGLLLASSIFIVPQELVHEFTSHEDSIDHVDAHHAYDSVGEEHHHCESLQLSTPPFFHFSILTAFNIDRFEDILPVSNASRPCVLLSPFLFFRGPPVV